MIEVVTVRALGGVFGCALRSVFRIPSNADAVSGLAVVGEKK